MAYISKPNIHFANKLSTGIDKVPNGMMVIIEDYDGTIKSFIKNNNTNITSTTQIQDLFDSNGNALSSIKDVTSTNIKTTLAGAIGNINSPLLDLPLNNSLSMKQGTGSITFTRTTTATYIDRYGILQTAQVDEPRFEKEGLLIEGSSTNLALYSDDIPNAIWTKTNATVQSNALVSPDGNTTGDIFNRTLSGLSSLEQTNITIGAGITVTLSAWLYGDGSSFSFGGTDIGTTNTSQLISITPPNGIWTRYEHSWTTSTGTTSVNIQPIVDTTGLTTNIGIWGVQFETLSFASSYIPTLSSSVLRDSDNCEITYTNNVPQRNISYSHFCDYDILGSDVIDNAALWSVLTSPVSYIYVSGVNNDNIAINYSNSNISIGTNSLYKTSTNIGTVVNSIDTKVYIDGILKYTDTSGFSSIIQNFNTMRIGDTGTNSKLFGHIKNFKIYDKVLTEQEISLLGGK